MRRSFDIFGLTQTHHDEEARSPVHVQRHDQRGEEREDRNQKEALKVVHPEQSQCSDDCGLFVLVVVFEIYIAGRYLLTVDASNISL